MFHIHEQGFLFGADERPLYFRTEKKRGEGIKFKYPLRNSMKLLYFVNYSYCVY